MSKNDRMLLTAYDLRIAVNGTDCGAENGLTRLYEGDLLEIMLTIENEADIEEVFLHTDMYSDHWELLPFEKSGESWRYGIKARRGGRASFRFAAADRDNFYWEPDDYHGLLVDPAVMKSVRIYTMIPNATGTVADWRKDLKRISEMNFNAVHLLPFTAMCPSESPYAATDLFAMDRAWGGGIEEFREFSAEAAELGISICLDIVFNHVGFDNVLCRQNADWIAADRSRPDGMKRAGCWHHDSWISWEDLVLINYEHPDTQRRYRLYDYMFEYVTYWIEAAGGEHVIIRLDNLHSSNEHFIKWIIPQIRKKYPGIIVLSEFFGSDGQIDQAVRDYGLNLITANSWEYPFAPDLQRYLASVHSHSGAARYFLAPVSHDTEPAAKLFGTAESSIPRYAVCTLMGTGASGIVQGFEKGVPEKINFIGRGRVRVEDKGYNFSSFISKVNSLLAAESAFNDRGNIEFYDTGNDSLIVCRRREVSGGIVVAVNLDIWNTHNFDYPFIGSFETLLCERAEVKHGSNEDRIHIKLEACGVSAVRITK